MAITQAVVNSMYVSIDRLYADNTWITVSLFRSFLDGGAFMDKAAKDLTVRMVDNHSGNVIRTQIGKAPRKSRAKARFELF